MMHTPAHGISRRGALKLFGLAIGGAVASPLVPSPLRSTTRRTSASKGSLGIAVLHTSCGTIPNGVEDFVRGLRRSLDASTTPDGTDTSRIDVRAIAPGLAAARTAIAELAADPTVDLIVGLVGAQLTGWLRPTIEEQGVPFIEASFGECIARSSGDSPLVSRSTLGYWQANWALGDWAARRLGPRSLVVTTMLDSGSDMLRAWSGGVEQAGGRIVGVHIVDADPRVPGLGRPLTEAVADADHIHLLVRLDSAESARRMIAAQGVSARLPIVPSPLSIDAASGSWLPGLENRSNAAFVSAWRKEHGRHPSDAAALGHETGLMIASARAECSTGGDLAAALADGSWRGTRGRASMTAASNSVTAPLYLNAPVGAPSALGPGLVPDERDERIRMIRDAAFSASSHSYLG